MAFKCATCDELHEGLPDIGFAKPDPWFDVPAAERERRTRLTSDVCSIDDEQFFVRGVLYLPIAGSSQSLGLGVWVSQAKHNFELYLGETDEAPLPPTFGWLSTHLRCYGVSTFALETTVHFHGTKQRPSIELAPADHPLAIEQRQGITQDRAWQIVHAFEG